MKEAFFETLKGCLGDRETARVHFITPNEIDGYAQEMCTTCPPGLAIHLHEGQISVPISALTRAFVTTEPNTLERAEAIMEDEAVATNILFTPCIEHVFATIEDDDIIILYAGLRAFASSVAFIEEIHQTHPNVHVLVIMCDCKEAERTSRLQSLQNTEAIKYLWITRNCGGHMEMNAAVTEVIRIWEARG